MQLTVANWMFFISGATLAGLLLGHYWGWHDGIKYIEQELVIRDLIKIDVQKKEWVFHNTSKETVT